MFHLKDDYYFDRKENGTVEIVKLEDEQRVLITTDNYGWASVISEVAANDDMPAELFEFALRFHTTKDFNHLTFLALFLGKKVYTPQGIGTLISINVSGNVICELDSKTKEQNKAGFEFHAETVTPIRNVR